MKDQSDPFENMLNLKKITTTKDYIKFVEKPLNGPDEELDAIARGIETGSRKEDNSNAE